MNNNIHSYKDILNMFSNLVYEQIKVGKKKHLFGHVIKVDGPPVAFRPKRLNLEKTNAPNEIFDDMLEKNIINPTSSPWASPVQLALKNGSFRLVHDYRLINKHFKKKLSITMVNRFYSTNSWRNYFFFIRFKKYFLATGCLPH